MSTICRLLSTTHTVVFNQVLYYFLQVNTLQLGDQQILNFRRPGTIVLNRGSPHHEAHKTGKAISY